MFNIQKEEKLKSIWFQSMTTYLRNFFIPLHGTLPHLSIINNFFFNFIILCAFNWIQRLYDKILPTVVKYSYSILIVENIKKK